MSPSAALRNRGYGERHRGVAAEVRERAKVWEREKGYVPTYWTLVELARASVTR